MKHFQGQKEISDFHEMLDALQSSTADISSSSIRSSYDSSKNVTLTGSIMPCIKSKFNPDKDLTLNVEITEAISEDFKKTV